MGYRMASLPTQTRALLQAASALVDVLHADAVLLLTEKDLDWGAVRSVLGQRQLLVATGRKALREELRKEPNLNYLEFDPGPAPSSEWLNFALLEAVRSEKLPQSGTVVALFNGISIGEKPEPIDSLSIIRMEHHVERLTSSDLKSLDSVVPLETLKAVVDLALEIARDGREGHRVGTLFVVGDTKKVATLCQPMNFNPFRGYSEPDRDVRKKQVREQIKDIAQMEGAILIRKDGVAMYACMRIEAPSDASITLSMGLGTRHAAAARVTKATNAVAVSVSQSGGVVRLWHRGQIVLTIVPTTRPSIYGPLQQVQPETNGTNHSAPTRAIQNSD